MSSIDHGGRGTLRVVRHLSQRGTGDVNEDAYGWSEEAAWVIDGASGIGLRKLSAEASDAAWYARTVSAALARHVGGTLPLAGVLAAAIEEARAAFKTLHDGDLEPFEAPSACGALVRFDALRVEYALLGDCTLIAGTTAEPLVIRDQRVSELERPILARLSALLGAGVSDRAAIRSEILPMVLEMRTRMNRPGGYYALSLEPAAAAQAVTGTLDRRRDAPIVLLTDGFSRLFDTLSACSAAEFYGRACTRGFAGLYDALRRAESADPEARRFPRLKLSDDATGLAVV